MSKQDDKSTDDNQDLANLQEVGRKIRIQSSLSEINKGGDISKGLQALIDDGVLDVPDDTLLERPKSSLN